MNQVTSKLLSPAAYARHRGCSRPAVARAVREGRITATPEGLIDPAVADIQWQAHTRPRVRVKGRQAAELPLDAGPPRVTYDEARRRQAVADAIMAERAERLQAGSLVRLDDITREHSRLLTSLRDAFRNIPARLCATLAAEADPHRVDALLQAEIDAALRLAAGAP